MKIELNQLKETENLKTKTEKPDKNNQDIDFKGLLGNVTANSLPFWDGNYFIANDEMLLNDSDISGIKSSYSYDILRMDRDDAMFFAGAVKGEEMACLDNRIVMKDVEKLGETEQVYKSAEVSKTLMNMLSESMNKNKPVRIDFGNDISAVIKVDRQGRIAAEFIPSDKAAEEFLKNNLSYLRETFEKESIPYNELSYRQQKRQQRNNNRKDNMGEQV